MAKENRYEDIIVESYEPKDTSGKHGDVHIRPVAGEKYSQDLQVECSKKLSNDYPVGTKFSVKAKLTDREDGGEYLYSSYQWKHTVIKSKD